MPDHIPAVDDDPLWYKDAVVYQAHVKAYQDADGDGIGDFQGLIRRLDYLQELGVTALWLLPFYPSPLRDDGYDIADYTGIHPDYGTMRDFKALLRETHDRGLRVITELVINHTSDQHPWFRRAREAPPGSRWRDFYVWSDTPDRYPEARIIFSDTEPSNWSWDPVAQQYYWHRFFSHQPDLNFESADVREAIFGVLEHWLELGVDGLRLDAVPYLYEREGTMCENLPETHAFLKELRARVDERFPNRMLLAEANQWPEDAVAYFGNGDECHMCFHFPVMPRLFMAVRQEDRFPILDIMDQTPAIPDTCQWAVFLRNHDELTLEMVTDEERDYMYRVYARDPRARINLGIRRRLAPLLQNNRREIELMNALLFSLPGTPIIYYGDEIGMGDNIYLGDRNGVRTPMQWSPDRNAGFSRTNPQQLYLPMIIDPEYHYETVNVEAQQNNPNSLLWWTRRMIGIRKRFPVFGRGDLRFLHPENPKVLAFLREDDDLAILVVANLSRFVQAVELDLAEFEGVVPVEVFGHTWFPPIGELPYFLTLGPHAFYWFVLEPERTLGAVPAGDDGPPVVRVRSVKGTLRGRAGERLGEILVDDLPNRRWFGGKARGLRSVEIGEVIPVPLPQGREDLHAFLVFARTEYRQGSPETYLLPLALTFGEEAGRLLSEQPRPLVARVQMAGREEAGALYDAMSEPEVAATLLAAVASRRRFKGGQGEVGARPTPAYRELRGPKDASIEPRLSRAEQSNTSVIYGDRFILKLFRRLDTGLNPDLEIGRFLTEAGFRHVPQVAGALEYRPERGDPMTLGILQGYIPNQGDAWAYTLDDLSRYYERVLTTPEEDLDHPEIPRGSLTRAAEPPEAMAEMIGPYLQAAELLGHRTAELHLALASETKDPAFAPEPFTTLYQRSLYQSMRSLTRQTLGTLRRRLSGLPEELGEDARDLAGREGELLERFRAITEGKVAALRIRTHGDYHLGQVLWTGKDFVIIDFEGEPARPLSERRLKRSPLRDVAGMVRSFHYAAWTELYEQAARGAIAERPEALADLAPWAAAWYRWVSAAFLVSYRETVAPGGLLPTDPEALATLVDAYLLEKAVYELGYELDNRPDWVRIPLRGIQELLEG